MGQSSGYNTHKSSSGLFGGAEGTGKQYGSRPAVAPFANPLRLKPTLAVTRDTELINPQVTRTDTPRDPDLRLSLRMQLSIHGA